MNPPYQRKGGLWSARDRSFLIDSILNGYDIPKIYIADFTFRDSPLNLKRKQYAMIDGKQRFETICGFFEGSVLLDRTFTYADDPGTVLAGLGYKDLKSGYPLIAEHFDNFNLSVMSVITDQDERISELFVRLNRNRPLTGAELRNAMAGPIPEFIRDIASHRFFTQNIRFGTARGQDQNGAAKLLLTEFRGELVDVKKVDLDRFTEEALQAEAPLFDFEQAAMRAKKLLNTLTDVFTERDPLLSSEGPLVVYYWLARSLHEPERLTMRQFLVEFEEERRRNRRILKDNPESERVNTELIRYDDFNRSTNDAGSLRGRLAILLRRHSDWAHR
jgi:hypothetical protein